MSCEFHVCSPILPTQGQETKSNPNYSFQLRHMVLYLGRSGNTGCLLLHPRTDLLGMDRKGQKLDYQNYSTFMEVADTTHKATAIHEPMRVRSRYTSPRNK